MSPSISKKPHGLILAGIQSSSGKTTITCLLLAALKAKGLPIQPFKVGPDFIDPGYHTKICGVPCRNLDTWMMGRAGIQEEVTRHGTGKISVVEGVMGLFDGSDVRSDQGSTMELARILNWPILLVIPAEKAGRSLAAALRGFLAEAGKNRIQGIILNQVSGQSHTDYLRQAIKPLKVPILGAIPICKELRWPERYLGLQASQERKLPKKEDLARLAEKFLDIEKIVSMVSPMDHKISTTVRRAARAPQSQSIRIAIARDEAFHFYYESNLDYLRNHGVQLIEFSPLHDSSLPSKVDGLIFGGGFPELFAEQLSQNKSMLREIKSAIEGGLACYAECGGLMLLAKELVTSQGNRYPMLGIIPGAVKMTERLNHFGYCTCTGHSELGKTIFRGHEFHYSKWQGEESRANLWQAQRKATGLKRQEGFRFKNLHASYVHLYWPRSKSIFPELFKI